MALLSLRDLSIGFGGPPLIERADLQIEKGERIGLVGRNGEGKSTLLKALNHELEPDHGEIVFYRGARTGLLPQDVPKGLSGTVRDVVAGGELSMERGEEEDWRNSRRIGRALSLLELDPAADFERLSAGMKRRVLFARCVACEPDLLLLDEPTNHLDLASIEWLEAFLYRHDGAFLFVTHDRMLLRNLATRIIDLDRGKLTIWNCDYDTYLARKQAALEAEAKHWAEFDRKLAAEERWIREGIKARRTRNEGRVRELERHREERRLRRVRPGQVRLEIQKAEKTGQKVIEAEGLCFGYGQDPLICDLTTLILRGDRVGIVGPNGSGKTTLIRLLVGEIPPSDGHVRHGTKLRVAYFDQMRAHLDEQKSVAENIAGGNPMVFINGRARPVVRYLQDFLFTADRARSPVSFLSGGERNRLLVAKLFTRPSNVLVMDEPTNDLDAETLELLEEMLLTYPGTLLLVSHDRAFLDNVVTSLLAFEGEGRVNEYVGGYEDWLKQRKPPTPSVPVKKKSKKEKAGPKRERTRRPTYREKQELEALPHRIEELEAMLESLHRTMGNPAFYRREGGEIAEAKARLQSLEKELREAYVRWEFLEALFR
jgi:ATP-binding cassette subfamily F protein uup